MLNILCTTLHPNFYPGNLQYSNMYFQSGGNTVCVDPDQIALSMDLKCFQKMKNQVSAGQGFINFYKLL